MFNHLTNEELLAVCDQHYANPLSVELQTRLAGCVDRLCDLRVESANRDEQLQRLIRLSELLSSRIENLENTILLSVTA